jgi:hypothetical protein
MDRARRSGQRPAARLGAPRACGIRSWGRGRTRARPFSSCQGGAGYTL